MKVLILGGAGYIGSILQEYLIQQGDEAVVMDNFMYERSKNILISVPFTKGDIRNINDLIPVVAKVDAVVQLAAISNDPASDLKPELTWRINYKANETIASLCHASNKRIVYASSCSVYGFSENGTFYEESNLNPITLYAQTKMLSEKFYVQKEVDAIVLRFATVYGYSPKTRFDLVVNTMIGTSFFDGKVIINGGTQWRPIVHVKDVAHAIYLALHAQNPAHKVYNVGSNEQNYQIGELAELIVEMLPHVKLIIHEDGIDKRSYNVDFSRIKEDLGFSVRYTVKDAVREFYEQFEKKMIKSMEEDEYYRVKYLRKYVYHETLFKKIIGRIPYLTLHSYE